MQSIPRREFLAQLAVASTAAALGAAQEDRRSLIILWLAGGVPHTDLWSPGQLVGTANQGPYQPIKTTANGIEISELLPTVALHFKHLSIIRTVNSREGDVERGTYRMSTGMAPGTRAYPHFGALAAHFLGNAWTPPRFVSVGRTAVEIGRGNLDEECAPFPISQPGQAPEVLMPPRDKESLRSLLRRKDLLEVLETNFQSDLKAGGAERRTAADAHAERAAAASKLLTMGQPERFEFNADDQRRLAQYGDNPFGRGCLLARKLVERGVRAVQVDLTDPPSDVRQLAAKLDRGMGALIAELAERDRLKDTAVVCLGPFGFSPRLTAAGQRRPWTQGWDVVLGGAGINPGIAFGKMDADGIAIQLDPVAPLQLMTTLYAALGIDLKDPLFRELYAPVTGRWQIEDDPQTKPIRLLLRN